MQAHSVVTRVTAPRCLADDMAVLTKRCLGKVDHTIAVNERQPVWVAIEDVLVVVGYTGEIPAKWLKSVDFFRAV